MIESDEIFGLSGLSTGGVEFTYLISLIQAQMIGAQRICESPVQNMQLYLISLGGIFAKQLTQVMLYRPSALT